MKETWKTIPDFPSYAVSDLGNVMRVTSGPGTRAGRLLSPFTWGSGNYFHVNLMLNAKAHVYAVHRLVLEVFNGSIPVGTECNHKNLDVHDNRLCNLEWISHKENLRHATLHGRTGKLFWKGNQLATKSKGVSRNQGVACAASKLTEADVINIRNRYDNNERVCEIAPDYPMVSSGNVWCVAKRLSWKHIR